MKPIDKLKELGFDADKFIEIGRGVSKNEPDLAGGNFKPNIEFDLQVYKDVTGVDFPIDKIRELDKSHWYLHGYLNALTVILNQIKK